MERINKRLLTFLESLIEKKEMSAAEFCTMCALARADDLRKMKAFIDYAPALHLFDAIIEEKERHEKK